MESRKAYRRPYSDSSRESEYLPVKRKPRRKCKYVYSSNSKIKNPEEESKSHAKKQQRNPKKTTTTNRKRKKKR